MPHSRQGSTCDLILILFWKSFFFHLFILLVVVNRNPIFSPALLSRIVYKSSRIPISLEGYVSLNTMRILVSSPCNNKMYLSIYKSQNPRVTHNVFAKIINSHQTPTIFHTVINVWIRIATNPRAKQLHLGTRKLECNSFT